MMSLQTVAALYVDRLGTYACMPGIDPWDESRDARKYDGPHPVVAHPPCNVWCVMSHSAYARWGGEHNRPGNDGGCFEHAMNSVMRFGGVLEHPARTEAFKAFNIPKPTVIGWQPVAERQWVCEVWQSAYGHRAAKATWLFYVGDHKPDDANWIRTAGTHQVSIDNRPREKQKPALSKREAKATPIEFARYLVALARATKG